MTAITATSVYSSGPQRVIKKAITAGSLQITAHIAATPETTAEAAVKLIAHALTPMFEKIPSKVWEEAVRTLTTPQLTVEDIASSVLAAQIEPGATVAQSMRLSNAVLGGATLGAGTGIEKFKSLDGTIDRVVSSVNRDGLRSEVHLSLGT